MMWECNLRRVDHWIKLNKIWIKLNKIYDNMKYMIMNKIEGYVDFFILGVILIFTFLLGMWFLDYKFCNSLYIVFTMHANYDFE